MKINKNHSQNSILGQTHANFKLNGVISLLSEFGYKVYDIQDDDSLIEIDEFIDDYQYNNYQPI